MENNQEPLPSKVLIIGIFNIISGILIILGLIFTTLIYLVFGAILTGTIILAILGIILLIWGVFYLLIIIGGVLELIWGIKIIKGHKFDTLPIYSAIVQIVIGIFLVQSLVGIVILGFGIANLVLLLQPDVKEYFHGSE